jgi:hypothetical protein
MKNKTVLGIKDSHGVEEVCNEINKLTIGNSGETFPHSKEVYLPLVRICQVWKTIQRKWEQGESSNWYRTFANSCSSV